MDLRTTRDDFTNGNYQRDENLFVPKRSKFQQGAYSATIRYIPWYKDHTKSKYRKSEISIKSTISNDRLKFDCPSNGGQPSIFFDLYKILRERTKLDQNDLIAKKISENFSRYNGYYSIIYVKENQYDPETVNRLYIYKFGAQIDTRINLLLNPINKNQNTECNPYDLVNGKDMIFTATAKTKFYNDYSMSRFVDAPSPFSFYYKGNDGQIHQHTVTDEELNRLAQGESTMLGNYLINNSPDLSKYLYKEPSQETILMALNYLKNILMPYPAILNYLLNGSTDIKSVNILKSLLSNSMNNQVPNPMAGMGMNEPQVPNPMAGNNVPNPMVGNNVPNPMAGNNVPNPMVGNNVPNPMVGNNVPSPMAGNNVPNPMVGNNVPNPMAGNNVPNPMVGNNVPSPMAGNNAPNPMTDDNASNPMVGNNVPNPMADDNVPNPMAGNNVSNPMTDMANNNQNNNPMANNNQIPNPMGNVNNSAQPDNNFDIQKPVNAQPTQAQQPENVKTEADLKNETVSTFGNILNNINV